MTKSPKLPSISERANPTLTVQLPRALMKRLRRYVEKQQDELTVSELVRYAIDECLDRWEKESANS